MRLNGKVAVITGGTKGIGRVTAIMMAQQGARVVLTGRSEETGREVEERIREVGSTGIFVRADNKIEAEAAGAVYKAAEAYGPVTVLMNNAIATDDVGSDGDSHVHHLDTNELDEIMKAELYGAIWASKAAIPYMRQAGVGSVINISASSSIGSIPGRPAY
ncbi:MAG: SDR family NAD(P)-dependent oxidoreductase, partial [Alphaproteobacteria bacterium]|nr:SDR family NAD(P)-dependent oxidoreductase [Alphaproteobacteria bacterium]